MNKKFLGAVIGVGLITTACGLFSSPQVTETLNTALDTLVFNGTLTMEQKQAILDALKGGQFSEILITAGQIILSVVGSLLGVGLWRGGVNNRKGVAPVVSLKTNG